MEIQVATLKNPENEMFLRKYKIELFMVIFFITTAVLTVFYGLAEYSTDDYMRLVQVQNFLDGAGWFNMQESRLNPSTGIWMHWSRIPDLPLALVIAFCNLFTSQQTSILIASYVVPAFYFIALAILSVSLAKKLVDTKNYVLTLILLGLSFHVFFRFIPYAVDHHNIQLLLTLAVTLCLVNSFDKDGLLYPVLAGLCAALSIAIGMETLPYVLAPNLIYFLLWILNGQHLKKALAFALASAGASLLLFPALIPADRYFIAACDAFSLEQVKILGIIAAFWGAVALIPMQKTTQKSRLTLGGGVGFLTLGALLLSVGSCMGSPYGHIDPKVQEFWLNDVSEAQSILDIVSDRPLEFFVYYFTPLLSILYGLHYFYKKKYKGDPRATIIFTLLVLGIMSYVSSLWQIRSLSIMLFFSLFLLTLFLLELNSAIEKNLSGFKKELAMLSTILFLTPFLALIVAGVLQLHEMFTQDFQDNKLALGAENGKDNDGSALEEPVCDLASSLASMPESSREGVVLSTIDRGPQILFETGFSVMGAPYHRNEKGILTSVNFFTQSAKKARLIATDTSALYVFYCTDDPEVPYYRDLNDHNILHLIDKEKVPSWLTPLPLPESNTARLFKVDVSK